MTNEHPYETCAAFNVFRVYFKDGAQLKHLMWGKPCCITNIFTSQSNYSPHLSVCEAEIHREEGGSNCMAGEEGVDVTLPSAEGVDVMMSTEAAINEGDVAACV